MRYSFFQNTEHRAYNRHGVLYGDEYGGIVRIRFSVPFLYINTALSPRGQRGENRIYQNIKRF